MSRYTISQISNKDFDTSLLDFDEQKIADMKLRANTSISDVLRNIAYNSDWCISEKSIHAMESRNFDAEKSYGTKEMEEFKDFFSSSLFMEKMKFSSEEIASFLFVPKLYERCFEDLFFYDEVMVDYEIRGIVCEHKELLTREFFNKLLYNCLSRSFRSDVFLSKYISNQDRINYIENISTGEFNITEEALNYFLDMAPPEKVRNLTKSVYPNIRILSYKKLGVANHIDEMILSSDNVIRHMAVRIMDFGDPRFSKFLKEKSKHVLMEVVAKCGEDLIPFFIGNYCVKKNNDLRTVLEKRFDTK